MSSRTSRRMGLRGLVLGGAVAVSSFSLSGCWAAIAGAYVYAHQVDKTNEANKEAARIQADAIRDAARTQAGNNNQYANASYNLGANEICYIPMTCRGYEDDNPRDGIISVNGFYGKGVNTLAPGETLFTVLVPVAGVPRPYSIIEIGLYDSQGRLFNEKVFNNFGLGQFPSWEFRGVEGQKEDTITAKWKVNGKPSGESVFRIIGSSNINLISNR